MDLLVKLYALPTDTPIRLPEDVEIRKPIGPEKNVVLDWIGKVFSDGWRSEADCAFRNNETSIYIAVQDKKLLGFACYDATAKGYFGPLGVTESARGNRIGKKLLMSCLRDMKSYGYGYAVVPTNQVEFYRRYLDVMIIPESEPGIYRDMLT